MVPPHGGPGRYDRAVRRRLLTAIGSVLLVACASVPPSQTPSNAPPTIASSSHIAPTPVISLASTLPEPSLSATSSSAPVASASPPAPSTTPSPSTSSADSDGDELTDAWETQWGLTDPGKADSNGNGVPDSAEDPDGDGLSNLAEQHFGTNPGVADTNGNGIPDGLDDSNGNGIPDGLEQDRRPVPANLNPSLADAPNDKATSYSNGCHTFQGSATIHPCVYGDAAGTTTIAVFGDSHALQWVPGLTRAATANHWRLLAITKSGCPSVDVIFDSRAFPNDRVACQQWRRRATGWLGTHVPDLIIVANSRGYNIVDKGGHPRPLDPAWQVGLARTLVALPQTARRVVLGDTPHLGLDPVPCLAMHPTNISACETGRGLAENRQHDDAERATATANGASFVSLNALVCSYDPCPLIEGNVLVWRNASHLTATWVSQLWPSLAALVATSLAAASTGTAARSVCRGYGECPTALAPQCRAYSGPSVPPPSPTKTGVQGYANADAASVGVRGESPAGRGGVFKGAAAQVRLAASTASTHPASGQRGDLFVDKVGRLWFCKTGTTWKLLVP